MNVAHAYVAFDDKERKWYGIVKTVYDDDEDHWLHWMGPMREVRRKAEEDLEGIVQYARGVVHIVEGPPEDEGDKFLEHSEVIRGVNGEPIEVNLIRKPVENRR